MLRSLLPLRHPATRIHALNATLVPHRALRNGILNSPTPNHVPSKRLTRGYTTTPGPMPLWNPYPTRGDGWAARVWYRPDGRPRSKFKGALFVALSTFTLLMCNSGLDLIADYERVAFLLAYLVLAQQVDKTFSEHDFESLESTKEYFYKLCRALPHDEDADEDDVEGTIEQFIELMETTIELAAKEDEASLPSEGSSSSLSSPPTSSSSSPTLSNPNPNIPTGGYLSHLTSPNPTLSAPSASPSPHPLQAIHNIMRSYSYQMHDLLLHDLNKATMLVCAQAALVGFKATVSALGAVSERVGAVESAEGVGRGMVVALGRSGSGMGGGGEGGGKGEGGGEKEGGAGGYESIG